MSEREKAVRSRQDAERSAKKKAIWERPEHRSMTLEERVRFEASVLRGIGGVRL